MRQIFDEELNQLNKDIISTGALCENAIKTSVQYLLSQDDDIQNEVKEIVEQINHKEREIENMCLRLLLQQQPVASDLRAISAALKMISDLERIGDNADDISEIVSMHNIKASEVENSFLLPMAKASMEMLSDSINSFVKRDGTLAQSVIDGDDTIDDYFDKIKVELTDNVSDGQLKIDAILDIFMVSKYFERISDHSVNIAQWVLYMITGNLEGNTN